MSEIFTVKESDNPRKQKMAIFNDGEKVYFGDPNMPEYPGTKRGDRYCTRTPRLAKGDSYIRSPNTLSRKVLWKCKGNKSMDTFKEAGLRILRK